MHMLIQGRKCRKSIYPKNKVSTVNGKLEDFIARSKNSQASPSTIEREWFANEIWHQAGC